MIITNRFDLPDPVYQAILWQESAHKANADISNTSLIDSPLRVWLYKKYNAYIEEDASERLWVLYGSLAHMICEKFGHKTGQHVEKQVIADVTSWKVSTTLDYILEDNVLSDYKLTSCWTTVEGVKDEWVKQLNVGLWLMRNCNDSEMVKVGEGVKKLEIVALFRDWVHSNADKFPHKVQKLPVTVWENDKAKSYIEERVVLHQEAQKDMNVVPPMCSDTERWMSDFAVMDKGKKTAVKAKIKTREEAEKWKAELNCDYIREAKPRRCEDYCVYAKNHVCPWFDYENKITRDEPEIAPISGCAEDPELRRKDGPNV